MNFEYIKDSVNATKSGEWLKWMEQIPFINFPLTWHIQVVPPFNGATIRFRIKLLEKEKIVSVYLDCYDLLGYFGKPYWEIYPDKDNDTNRFSMNDIEGLLKGIQDALESV